MHRKYYRFGSALFAVSSRESWQESSLCQAFLIEEDPGDKATYTIQVNFRDILPEPPAACVPRACIYRWDKGRQQLRRYERESASWTRYDERNVEVWFNPDYRGRLTTRLILEAAGLQELLINSGHLLLHSSYVCRKEGDAILFCGPCGIGKSTQAALWEKNRGAKIVNGDRCLVEPAVGMAHGIFYSGTSGICHNISAPIRALVLLEKAERNIARKPSMGNAYAAIYEQSSFPQEDLATADRTADLILTALERIPVIRYACTKKQDAVCALEEVLRRQTWICKDRKWSMIF